MMKQTTCYSCDKPIEPEWLPEGEFIVCDECSSDTDKLSVEKLQERCDRYEKALTEIADVKRRLEQTTDFGVGFQTTNNALAFAVVESEKALAAIGGDDEKV